jgi:hypothetical protein
MCQRPVRSKCMYMNDERIRSALIPSKRSFRALSCRYLSAGLESTNRFCEIVRYGMGSTTSSAVVGYYGNRHCQASKGFDKHVRDDDAGFVDTSKIYLDC